MESFLYNNVFPIGSLCIHLDCNLHGSPWILYKTQQPTDGSPSSLMALSNGHWSGFIMAVASVQKAKVSAVFFPAVFLLQVPSGS